MSRRTGLQASLVWTGNQFLSPRARGQPRVEITQRPLMPPGVSFILGASMGSPKLPLHPLVRDDLTLIHALMHGQKDRIVRAGNHGDRNEPT